MSDVRVFDINNIASIYEELNCAGNKKQTLLATIILFYVFDLAIISCPGSTTILTFSVSVMV